MTPTPATSGLSAAAEALVTALAMAGDDAAFEDLVRRRQGGVRALMRRLSGDAALADDLAQEAFVQARRTLGTLRSPMALGGWLRQLAINVWLQHARRARLLTDSLEDAEPRLDAAAAARPSQGAERLDLERALAHLKAPERLCVILAHAEGMSHGEIAAATGWPLGTVKSHLARGGARLRAWLRPEGDTP